MAHAVKVCEGVNINGKNGLACIGQSLKLVVAAHESLAYYPLYVT